MRYQYGVPRFAEIPRHIVISLQVGDVSTTAEEEQEGVRTMLRTIAIMLTAAAIFTVGPITHASPPQITPGTRLVCPAELGNTCFVFGGTYLPDYDRAKTEIEAQDKESYEWNFSKGCDHKILPYIHPGELCYGLWVKAQPMPGLTADTLNESIRQVDYKICRHGVTRQDAAGAIDQFVSCLEEMQHLRAEAKQRPPVTGWSL